MEALTIKIDSQFQEIKGEMKEMQDGCDKFEEPHPSSECDDKPMRGPKEEANYIYKGFKQGQKNHQAAIHDLETKFGRLSDQDSTRPTGSLPSNTQTNLKHSPFNDKPYRPPFARNEYVNAIFTRSEPHGMISNDVCDVSSAYGIDHKLPNRYVELRTVLSDTRPPMLDRTDFASWQQRIRLYCQGKENGVNILKSIDEGPFKMGTFRETLAEGNEGALHLGPERARVYSDLSPEDKDRYNADIRATNILLQGLPKDIYTLINHYTDAKDIWDNVKMLLEDAAGYGVAQNRVRNANLADDCDAFDSNVDEAPTAQTMFMANLSSTDPVYDEASPSYSLDILSEVPDHDNYQDAIFEHHEVHEMHDDVQPNYVVDSHTNYTAQSVSVNKQDKVVNASLTAKLVTYKEQVELYERHAKFELIEREQKIDEHLRIVIIDCNIKEENLKRELHSIKMQLNSTINHNKLMDLLKIKAGALKEQTTSSRQTKALMMYPPNTPATLVPMVLPTKIQVKINIFALIPLFLEFEKTCKMRITPMRLTEGKRGFKQTKECYLTKVISFFKTLKEHFEGIQKALTKEMKEMKEILEELEAEVDQNVVNRKCDEIERKNILITNDNLIADCLSKEVFYIATNSELTVSRFNEMHDAHTVVQARCLELKVELSKLHDKVQTDDHTELVKRFSTLELFRAENEKVKQHYKELYDSIKITRAKHIKQITALLTKNENLKAQLREKMKCVTMDSVKPRVHAPGRYAIDVEPIPPRNRNNREVHLDYLKHLKESVETLREIVKEAKVVQIVLWYLDLGCSKHMTGDHSRLRNFMKKFIEIVRFRNDHFGAIMGYGDYVIGDSMISKVAFRKHSCYVRDTDGVELIKGSRGSNLYTISVENMMKSSTICLLSKASKNKSWLWHRHLNHLNFDTINELAIKDLVRGLPRLKFEKDHLCSACQLGKSKKHTHIPKPKNTNLEVLNTLYMDLCGPMRVQTINGKKYILVIVDDYSRFTWVKFLRSKDETPEFVINFLKQIQVGLNKTVRYIRTDNDTEFVNQILTKYYESVSIFHQKSVLRTPQQNDAEAIATAYYTQNRSLTHTRHNKTPYELVHDKKHDLTFFRVFGALCYPTNDSEDLGKFQLTADIGIFIGYAPSRKEPPCVERPVSPAPAVPVPVNSAGTPSFTTIDQDAPSLSHSPSSSVLQSPSSHQGVSVGSTIIENNPFAPVDNNPFINACYP
ncbi:retrovirus-related pol polyprotein from transposon TNT 1-94 [Tanacetum coccineum]|uniref:Retrovirus-related pol polyprotein from transposon TNT 1-94 n=1 Tax=Tanacetum coccineum TaxID=301880 RepID=A0ABQ5I5Z7_9ASTR